MRPPAITAQPVDVSTVEGATVTFSVATTGSVPLTYRWKRDGADVPGGTGSTLTITGVKDSDAGSYTVIVSNAAGTATSLPATLSLIQPNLTGPPFTWGFLMRGPCGGGITALGTDAAGNLLLVGNAPDMALPGLTNGPSCRFGMVVAKLDAAGRGIWRNQGVGSSGLKVTPSSVQADPDGNLWVAGNFSGAGMTIGATTLALAAGDMFVAKFSTNGILLWAKQASRARAGSLVLDSNGNAYLAGLLPGSGSPAPVVATFGSTNVSTAHPRPFITRIDPSGNFVWVRSTGNQTTFAQGASVALAPGGDLWFAGDFNRTMEYDTNVFTSVFAPPLQNFTRTSAFVARLNRDTGLPRWVQMYQGKGSVQDIKGIGSHPTGGAVLACNLTDSYFYPPTGISVLSGPGLVLRIDDQGIPLAAYEGARPVLDAAVSLAGATLLASQFLGEFNFGPIVFRSPNGQDQGAMLLLKPDLTPDLARSVTGLKGSEKTAIGRIALSAQGDALMSGSFFGTNVVFGPLVVRAPAIFSGGAFLGKLAATAPPSIAAAINESSLRLTWPTGGWILERVTALNGSFSPFAFVATTNAANGTVTVELSLDSTGSFFRLRQP